MIISGLKFSFIPKFTFVEKCYNLTKQTKSNQPTSQFDGFHRDRYTINISEYLSKL